jgi:FkbM family methyltransferase
MKSVLRKAIVDALRVGFRMTGETGRRLTAEAMALGDEVLLEVIERVDTRRGQISLYCLGDLSLWRARTLLTKEPETIEWIDGFADGDVFWDVGANVGLYSVYAAINRKIRVFSFEPSASNYMLLNRNIEINALSDHVRAFCIAFADRTCIDALNMQSTQLAGALSSFAEAIDHEGRGFKPVFQQGMVGYTIDDYIASFSPPFPNHLKIDVDGIEDKIVTGAKVTLADPRLRSLSIELEANRSEHTAAIIRQIEAAGLKFASRGHSAEFDNGPYADVYNYQFRRQTS